MSTGYDDRDDERDWPEDDASHHAGKSTLSAAETPDGPEPEDDAAHLPVRPVAARSPQPRRRGSYRPPSELDRE